MAATDPEAARMAAQMHSGGFPLDATINQFQPVAPSATLTTPPAPGGVTTNAADLPVPPRAMAVVGMPKSSPATVSKPPAVAVETKPVPVPVRWADAGLLGLLALGGWFCWRTRRESAPVG